MSTEELFEEDIPWNLLLSIKKKWCLFKLLSFSVFGTEPTQIFSGGLKRSSFMGGRWSPSLMPYLWRLWVYLTPHSWSFWVWRKALLTGDDRLRRKGKCTHEFPVDLAWDLPSSVLTLKKTKIWFVNRSVKRY